MKKYIVVALVVTGAALFAAKKEKKPSTSKPAKGEFVVSMSKDGSYKCITCPSFSSQPDLFSTNEDQKPYDHCNKCQIGAFFAREDGKLSCTYCENTLEVITALP